MTAPAHVLAAVRSIPHPRQEPDMTAPEPSPAEQAVIDRFGIFEPEEAIERVARAIFGFMPPISYNLRLAMARDAAQAAIHAMQPSPAVREGDPAAAVERVEALVEKWGQRDSTEMRQRTRALRAALGGAR